MWPLKHAGHHEYTLLLSVVLWTEQVGIIILKTHREPQCWFQMWTSSKPRSPENNQPCNACSSVSAASPRKKRLFVHLMAFKCIKIVSWVLWALAYTSFPTVLDLWHTQQNNKLDPLIYKNMRRKWSLQQPPQCNEKIHVVISKVPSCGPWQLVLTPCRLHLDKLKPVWCDAAWLSWHLCCAIRWLKTSFLLLPTALLKLLQCPQHSLCLFPILSPWLFSLDGFII